MIAGVGRVPTNVLLTRVNKLDGRLVHFRGQVYSYDTLLTARASSIEEKFNNNRYTHRSPWLFEYVHNHVTVLYLDIRCWTDTENSIFL